MGEISLDVNVAYEDQACECQELLLAPAEFGILHVSLHDAHESLGVRKLCVGDLVEDHGVPSADLPDLASIEVDEQLRRRSLSSGQDMRII